MAKTTPEEKAEIAEERAIAAELIQLHHRIRKLTYRSNTDTPGFRLRGLCYRMWAESTYTVLAYMGEKYKKVPTDPPSDNGEELVACSTEASNPGQL